MRLQAVRTVASDGKFHRLPPDKENAGLDQIWKMEPYDINLMVYLLGKEVDQCIFVWK